MDRTIPGIHHVTAIAGDPQANLDFYTGFLGLRLVKQTVNFDEPDTFHFYYGDESGRPGSLLTFFPFTFAAPGRVGAGMASTTAFAVPETAFDYWMGRFADDGRDFDGPKTRFGQQVLAFTDPDGLRLELVAEAGLNDAPPGWAGGSVPGEHAIRRLHAVALCLEASERTARLLTETFGYAAVGESEGRLRVRARGDAGAAVVDLLCQPSRMSGRMGAGTVHHVAFRARDEAEQRAWREAVEALGLNVTPVLDRQYFRSVYFREPGGVLFEIATDAPGFAVDEAADALGTGLKLPDWLEPRRQGIERRLPPIRLPAVAR
jgi:glyoxalase family protein